LNANVPGHGTIVVDGGSESNASKTGLILSGNTTGQNIFVRDGGVGMESLRNVPQEAGNNLTFEDDNSYLYLSPGDGTIPAGQQTVVNPLGMTIHGFRAGDMISFLHEYAFGTESYTPLWDQANHQLTIMVTNSLHPNVSDALAQFTLDGNYSASEFQVNFVEPLRAGLHPQIDITTTHQGPANFAYTDAATGTSGGAAGDVYTGPVNYLQWQYIWSSPDGVAISANQPNAFLHGGSGNDALAACGGSNVLDGGDGSNFLVGASGQDGGVDTFFVDGRGGGTTWSTVVNVHAGDLVTFWGFDAAKSTYSWADNDGAAGYTGATIHAATGGVGTPVNASLTFAGLSLADAQSKLAITTGSVQGQDYMLIRFAG
ncbi:MAG: hypothetical protein JOZ05_07575, partial [Acetobacteraceae bacterium]|nr:hypothetical protein [Acetobacteraceae bacterium]